MAMPRWDDLFADLQAQAETLEQAERAAEVEERVRAEVGSTTLVDRLRPAVGASVRVHVGSLVLAGSLSRVGPDWLLLVEGSGREALVPLAAVVGVDGLPRLAAVPGTLDRVTARLGLWFLLRRLVRDRSGVRLTLTDGSELFATLDRSGADFVEAAVHPAGEARRPGAVQHVRLVPHTALAAIRREV